MRRMKYVVDFKLPDVKTRREIWVGNLTGKVNLSNIDFDYLAQKIELSGGYIKNIIQNALFLAAKEGDSVNMKHILQSACNEYLKLGKLMTPADFEKYAYILM
jgi:ATP-dependent 26S proteasome regulatory subunit